MLRATAGLSRDSHRGRDCHLAVLFATLATPSTRSITTGRAALAKIKGQKVILGRGDFSYDENRGALYGAVILAVTNGKIVPAPSAY